MMRGSWGKSIQENKEGFPLVAFSFMLTVFAYGNGVDQHMRGALLGTTIWALVTWLGQIFVDNRRIGKVSLK